VLSRVPRPGDSQGTAQEGSAMDDWSTELRIVDGFAGKRGLGVLVEMGAAELGHKCHKNHTKKSGKWLNISLFPIDCCEKFQGSVQAMICFHAIFLRSWPWSTGICFQRSSHHETQRGQMSREISLTREHTWQDFVGGERMVRACVRIPWCSHNSSELDDSQVFFPHTVLKLVADSPQAAWDCIPRARLEVSNYCVYRIRRERQSSLVKNYRYLVAELYIMCISLCRFRYIYFSFLVSTCTYIHNKT